ncbi:MAG: protein kinase, partial [Rhodopirellula sp.]|nr:protein kinase [Rhodopirellula sp.]
IKTLPPEKMDRPETVARFHREMEAIGQLDDPHIVRAHDAGEVDGTHYLVMEFVDGLDLTQLQDRVGPLSVANACEIIRQAALGLQSAAKAGLVHRDIKPSNVMLTHNGTVKILDLGLAQISSLTDPVDRPELTSTGQIMGTFDYLAPEQATDTRNVDIRADIYGPGCTLFKLLTGQAPYWSPEPMTAYQRIRAHLESPIPSATACRTDVPAELDVLLSKMLAKQADDRLQTPQELVTQISTFCAGHDLPALMKSAHAETNAKVDTASVSGATVTFNSPVPSDAAFSVNRDTLIDVPPSASVGTSASLPPTVQAAGRRRPILPAVVVFTLAAGLVAYFAGLLTFSVKTDGGTIVLECDPAALQGAKIAIDGQEVQVTLAGDNQPVTIGVDKKRGQLQITKAGFKVFDSKFEIAVADNEQSIKVHLIPLEPVVMQPPGDQDRWLPGPSENVLPGLIPRPASFPGIKRWQIETILPRTQILCGTYSPDGRLIACGTESGYVRIYDAESLKLLDVLPDSTEKVLALAWSPDGQWLAFGGEEFVVRLWHVSEKRLVQIPVKNTGRTPCTAISWAKDSTRFAFANGFTIDICDVAGQRTRSLPANHVRAIAWSPDGETLAEGDFDGTVRLWSSKGEDFVAGPVVESTERIGCIAWSPDSQHFATGHHSATIRLWNKDGTPFDTIETEEPQTNSLTWSPAGDVLVSGGNRVAIHHLDDPVRSQVLPPSATPSIVCWHPEGKRFACVDGRRSISIWRPDGVQLKRATGHMDLGDKKQPMWSRDGQFLAASGDALNQTRVWSVDGQSTTVIAGGFPIAWHPHENKIIARGDQWGFQEWDSQGKSLGTLIPSRDFASSSVAWSPDGKQIAVGHDNSGVIEIWEPRGKRVADLKLPEPQRIHCIDWKRDGTALVNGGRSAWIWEPVRTHEPVKQLEGTGFYSIKWSAAGDRLAATPGNSGIWSLDGNRGPEFEGPRGGDYSVDWNPDGKRLVTGSSDRTVRIWSDEGISQAVLRGHQSVVWNVDWSPTGSHIVSGASDATVIVWDPETNEAVWVGVQLGTGDSATFSAAGKVLDGSPELIEEHFVYIVENEDGQQELLKPSEFQKRVQSERATDPHRALAEWVIQQGGSVGVFLKDRIGEIPVEKASDLPVETFTTNIIVIDGIATFGDAQVAQLAKLSRATGRTVELQLKDTSVTDAGLRHLESVEICHLYIYRSPVTDGGLASLKKVRGLNALGLAGEMATSRGMETITHIPGITRLSLSGSGIDDEALKELQRLPRLTSLSIPSTKITDAGLEYLVTHQNLTGLQLMHCPVGDVGMQHVRKLKNLTSLELQYTMVTDTGLRSLAALSKLKNLSLNRCDVSDASLGHLSEWFPDLEAMLSIQATKAGDGALKSIGQLRKLKVLYANGTDIADAGLKHLENLRQLELLHIQGTQVTEAAVQRLHAAIPQCRIHWDGGEIVPTNTPDPHRALAEWVIKQGGSVDVHHGEHGQQLDRRVAKVQDLPVSSVTVGGVHIVDVADFGDQQLMEFAELRRAATGLTELYLWDTSVTDAGLQYLRGLELGILSLSGRLITDAGLSPLQEIRGLGSLGLSSTSITSEGMKTVAQMHGLVSLNLYATAVDDEALLELRRLPNLQVITLTETKVTDAGMALLAAHQNLTLLQLINCDVGDAGMVHVRKLTNLTSLELAGTRVTDVGLRSLSPLTKLKKLGFNSPDVSDDSLSQVGEWFPNLEDELSIQDTRAGDEALKSIGQLKKLKVLRVNSTRITDAGLKHLENLTHLESLDVQRTQVTEAAVQRLHTAIPQCRIHWDGGVIEPTKSVE